MTAALLAQYERLIENASQRYIRAMPQYADDIRQEVRIAFMQSLETYDPSKGAIATHAYWVIRGRLAGIYRDGWARVRPEQPFATYACPHTGDRIDVEPADDNAATYDDMPEMIHAALDCLSEKERDIVTRRWLQDETLEAIGDRYGVSKERIRQVGERALGKLRKRLGRRFDVDYELRPL